MLTLRFYGQSDDLFEIEGTKGNEPDEVGCFDEAVAISVKAPDGAGLIVFGEYAPKVTGAGAWVIGISNLDDEVPIPDWPMRLGSARGDYSPLLTIEAPDDVVVSGVEP